MRLRSKLAQQYNAFWLSPLAGYDIVPSLQSCGEGCKVFGWMDILVGVVTWRGAIVRPARQLVVTCVFAGTDQNL